MAQELLYKLAGEYRAELLLLSEQYSVESSGLWLTDTTGYACLWVRDSGLLPVTDSRSGNGFVWAKLKGITYVSVYLSPNDPIDTFMSKLADLEDILRSAGGNLVVGGDLNAKSSAWGEEHTNTRGIAILEMAARLDLVVLNTGQTTTFRRAGTRGSIVDVTLASPNIAALVANWTVIEDYTASDYQYISFAIDRATTRPPQRRKPQRWNVARLNSDALRQVISNAPPPANLDNIITPSGVEDLISGT